MLHIAIRRCAGPAALATVVAVAGWAAFAGVGVAGAGADVTAVRGGGFGYHADDISLFGGAQPDTGPTPSVALASNASNSPQNASASTGLIQYGPATIFTSDQIDVSSAGTLGPSGSVTSTSEIDNINKATSQPSTGSEILTADNIRSTCTATEQSTTGATSVANGTLRTHAQAEGHDEGVVAIPANPPPNHKVAGHVHLGDTTDYFVVVFNEQVRNPDGSLTVNAVHEYFGATLDGQGNIVNEPNSILQGDLYLGQVVCGVTGGPGTTTTTGPGTTTTTLGGTTTTTMPGATTTTTTTTMPAAALPDASIRLKGTPWWLGEDIINTSGRDQTVRTRADAGDKRVFNIRVRNYGGTAGSFEISGTGDLGGFVTRYFRGRREITRQVENGTYRLDAVAPGDAEVLRLVVKVRRGAREGKVGVWRVTATSSAGADAVRARVKVT